MNEPVQTSDATRAMPLDNTDAKLFEDDFKEVPLDETADQNVRKKEKKAKNQPASLDVLDGLVEQAKMEEITPPADTAQTDTTTQPATSSFKADSAAPMGMQVETAPMAMSATNSSDTATILDPDNLMQGKGAPNEPEDADEQLDEDGDPVENDETLTGNAARTNAGAKSKTSPKPDYPEDSHMDAMPAENLPPIRVLEAALFLANKPMAHKQLQDLLAVPKDRLDALLGELAQIVPKDSSYELAVNEHGAALQLKPQYLHRVAKLSKEVELSKKSMRILALVAKKKELLQSDLKHFFKGEIYAYVTELKMAGYLESKKHGNTRKLKPTTKFFESFQVKEV
ncbi:SMC-Scp complex subunit ScpB [Candidatus Micrarchaeota archaeon]|nr:SMC-Scp complex subunit ScpB [Candidatus Micrarchaeota archaeon]